MVQSAISRQGMGMLPAWTPAQRADFLKQPMTFSHPLVGHHAFSDDALAALLDRYPDEAIDINLYDYDANGQVLLRTGARAGATGTDLLEAVRKGRLWLNCKYIMETAPEIAAAVHAMVDDMRLMRPDFKPRKIWGQLLISSPATRVPYHFDPSGVILFHIRGRKRIYVYPVDEAHVPAVEIEKIVAQQQPEELPYTMAMDARAKIYDLEPGGAVAWPFLAPHRVENLSSFCVSLSIDYLTREQQIETGAHYTNFGLRRLGVTPMAPRAMPAPARTALWLASGALKRLGVFKEKLSTIPRAFTPSADAADGARPIAALGRECESA
jgi:hypothetical protein